ncbi:MAG: cation diffusion facilitator family transporter [Pyrinomonadaceae bacterium]
MKVAVTVRADVVKRGRRLEYLTIGWNSVEGVVAIVAGVLAGSISLVGFGVDSLIELSSGAALLWRLHLDEPGKRERSEAVALKLVGICFLALAAYIFYDATKSLVRREVPEVSHLGIAIAMLSLIVMPLLARAKRRVAASIHSHALEADARQTDICAYLSVILLGGLVLNAIFGWWWSDPLAALVMTAIIAKEGIDGLRGKSCDDCHDPLGSR